jgi:molecular chaperone DnaK (HSP70)
MWKIKFFKEELEALNETISEAIKRVSKWGRIDEVQLIGEASIFNFVADHVRAIVGIPVRRDFDLRGALALGAVIDVLPKKSRSPHP